MCEERLSGFANLRVMLLLCILICAIEKFYVGMLIVRFDPINKFLLRQHGSPCQRLFFGAFCDLESVRLDIGGIYKMTELESADLSGNFISNLYALQYSESRNTLVELNLNDNAVTDATPLASLSRVEWLSLANNNISDPTALMNMNSLRVLVLTGNPLSTEQIDAVRLALPGCEVVF